MVASATVGFLPFFFVSSDFPFVLSSSVSGGMDERKESMSDTVLFPPLTLVAGRLSL